MIGVGVVGLGFGSRVHVPGFRLLADRGVRVEAVCARTPERVDAVARSLGVPRAYTSWRDLVADDRVSIVSIAVPPPAQAEIAEEALRAGKAVLCEKPVGLDVQRMRDVCRAADGLPALVNFSYRAVPAFELASSVVSRGLLGPVRRVSVCWRTRSRPPDRVDWSWKDDAGAGGGALLAYGIHAIDYVSWFVGVPAGVRGSIGPAANLPRLHEGRDRPATSEDSFTAELDFAGGTKADIELSLAWEGEPCHRVELAGESGVLVLENRDRVDPVRPWRVTLGDRVLSCEPRWALGPGVDPRVEPFTTHAGALIDATAGGAEAAPSMRDALDAHLVADALARSSESGRRESVRR